jgi:hypothetical protein
MITKSQQLHAAALALYQRTWAAAQAELGWSIEALALVVPHQVCVRGGSACGGCTPCLRSDWWA